MEFWIKKNEILLFSGKWMKLENIILSEVSQVQEAKGYMFSHMWNIAPINILYIQNMYPKVRLVEETKRGRKAGKKDMNDNEIHHNQYKNKI
jgi:hypothetical protein